MIMIMRTMLITIHLLVWGLPNKASETALTICHDRQGQTYAKDMTIAHGVSV